MKTIYDAKKEDWTCPNCGHESPMRTFPIIERLAEQIRDAEKLFDIVGWVTHRSPELYQAWNEYRIKYKGKE